jgi:hypothetical protein
MPSSTMSTQHTMCLTCQAVPDRFWETQQAMSMFVQQVLVHG